jgi:hypothetical protein
MLTSSLNTMPPLQCFIATVVMYKQILPTVATTLIFRIVSCDGSACMRGAANSWFMSALVESTIES